MAENISIKGLDKVEVLLALYNGSHVQGFGFLQSVSNYSIEDARKDIEANPYMYFDYLRGRVIKVDLSGDEFNPRLYDRDCGEGKAEAVISKLRKSKEEN